MFHIVLACAYDIVTCVLIARMWNVPSENLIARFNLNIFKNYFVFQNTRSQVLISDP